LVYYQHHGGRLPNTECLVRGRIFDPPEQDIKTAEWKYRVEGRDADGRWIAIGFAFKTVERVFLITVFSIEARGKK
jgi:hypothetical protein